MPRYRIVIEGFEWLKSLKESFGRKQWMNKIDKEIAAAASKPNSIMERI